MNIHLTFLQYFEELGLGIVCPVCRSPFKEKGIFNEKPVFACTANYFCSQMYSADAVDLCSNCSTFETNNFNIKVNAKTKSIFIYFSIDDNLLNRYLPEPISMLLDFNCFDIPLLLKRIQLYRTFS